MTSPVPYSPGSDVAAAVNVNVDEQAVRVLRRDGGRGEGVGFDACDFGGLDFDAEAFAQGGQGLKRDGGGDLSFPSVRGAGG